MMEWLLLAALAMGTLLWWWHTRNARSSFTPKVGDGAPAFTLPDQNGQARSLDEFRGKWLVLYFYLRDDTPG